MKANKYQKGKQAYYNCNLPAGSYTIEIKTNDYSYSTKLIVQ